MSTYVATVNFANGLFSTQEYEFPEFLATNSGYNLKYGGIIDYSKLGRVTRQKIYDDSGTLLNDKKINYKYVHPNFSFSSNKTYSKPIFKTIQNNFNGTINGVGYNGLIYNPQGSINIQNYYTAQLIESTEETSYLTSGNIYRKIFHEYYLNDHSMPLTHSYEVESDGFIKGNVFKFHRADDIFAINNNLITQIVGVGSFVA
jgi:hypothetical protein